MTIGGVAREVGEGMGVEYCAKVTLEWRLPSAVGELKMIIDKINCCSGVIIYNFGNPTA